MKKLIDKSAVVAEIEKELNTTKKYSTEYVNGKKYALKKILSFLDTLEVKEVDLEKEVNTYMTNEMKFLSDDVGYDTLSTIVKHFFELGLKAQKGE